MEIKHSIAIHRDVDDVWRVLVIDYGEVYKWARAVSSSKPNYEASSIGGAPIGGRSCHASFGPVEETITSFDPTEHKLGYRASGSAIPFFVRNLSGIWTLTPIGSATRVVLHFKANLMFRFSIVMGWMINRQFKRAIHETLGDLKYYIENGKPHPLKVSQSK